MESKTPSESVDNEMEEDETAQDSSADDFSASEDEWTPAKDEQTTGAETAIKRKAKEKPTKNPVGPARVSRRIAAKKGIILPEELVNQIPVIESTQDVSEDESDSEEVKKPTKKARRKPPNRGKVKTPRKNALPSDEPIKLTTFTVEELYRKYRPDLAIPSTSKEHTAPPIKRRKPNPEGGDGAGNESDSSGDDHLVDPSELDLNSDFFRPSEQEKEQRQAVDLYFDCNAGVELTDSDSEDIDAGEPIVGDPGAMTVAENRNPADAELGKKLIQQINQSSKAYMQMVQLAAAASARAGKDTNPQAGPSKINTTLDDRQQEDIDRLLVAGEKLTGRSKGLTAGFGRNDFVKVTPASQAQQAEGPKEIEITLKLAPVANGKVASSKRTFDVLTALKRFMNREKRNSQSHVHKVALLCWIGHGTHVNNALRKPSLMRFAQKKLLPGVMGQASKVSRPNGLTNLRYFQELTRYYRRTVTLKDDTMFYRQRQHPPLDKFLIFAIAKKVTYCRRDYILLFVLMLRILGVHARLIISPPVPPKQLPSDQLYRMNPKSPQELAMERKLLQDFRLAPRDSMVFVAKQKLRALIAKQRDTAQTGKASKRRAVGFSIPQLDGGADERVPVVAQDKKKKLKLMTGSFLKVESNRPDPQRAVTIAETDDQRSSVPDEVQKRRERILAAYRARAEKLASKKDAQSNGWYNVEDDKQKKKKKASGKMGVDYWVEVFCEHEDKWITIDVLKGDVYKLEDIVKQATQPIAYVLAWNNDGTIKDVSPRYISRLGSKKSKLRVEDAWLEKTLRPYRGKRTKRDLIEDVKFDRLLNKRPFPEQIGEYKAHPKYAIERYLLRNEAIYPPDAPILGYIREEPIYLRDCVHTLHSREAWLRQAKTVRLYEAPYKVVKAKAKYDRFTGAAITGQTVELFGEWQVQDYEPPVAKDGLVPRSAYGNVDLFQAYMLPKGTVHLQLPGLNRICRRLRIDCAQAITGFEYRSGGCQAVYDGFVVCEEFRDRVLDEWYCEQVELQEKEDERRRKRIYANWRRLIMGLSIRKKLKDRYNFDNM
ncbi:DNA repair protein complementing XP-C cells homolog [Anopheles marshallii]|uniref:DNA repair protein complementing XP-C cells homolog n=1 Tax=Anopheles marshallii TaxID=1521116 RepID=UPI00237A6BBC|nr:DNA repair protein complementing XP-C cells homolog [Anopheles marshallii]